MTTPTATTPFLERIAEIKCHSEATMILTILADAIHQPSTKRFVRSRDQRRERWLQLARVAGTQAERLGVVVTTARRKAAPARKLPVVPATGRAITSGEVNNDTITPANP